MRCYLWHYLHINKMKIDCLYHSFSTYITMNKALKLSRHTINFLRGDFIITKMSSNIVFKSSIAKILIIVWLLKIMLIMDFDDFLFFSPTSFWPSPKLLQHTCRPVVLHQCAAAHQLKITELYNTCTVQNDTWHHFLVPMTLIPICPLFNLKIACPHCCLYSFMPTFSFVSSFFHRLLVLVTICP
jgi:hypothetical protein